MYIQDNRISEREDIARLQYAQSEYFCAFIPLLFFFFFLIILFQAHSYCCTPISFYFVSFFFFFVLKLAKNNACPKLKSRFSFLRRSKGTQRLILGSLLISRVCFVLSCLVLSISLSRENPTPSFGLFRPLMRVHLLQYANERYTYSSFHVIITLYAHMAHYVS